MTSKDVNQLLRKLRRSAGPLARELSLPRRAKLLTADEIIARPEVVDERYPQLLQHSLRGVTLVELPAVAFHLRKLSKLPLGKQVKKLQALALEVDAFLEPLDEEFYSQCKLLETTIIMAMPKDTYSIYLRHAKAILTPAAEELIEAPSQESYRRYLKALRKTVEYFISSANPYLVQHLLDEIDALETRALLWHLC